MRNADSWSMDEITPQTALELAGAIASFAKSLADDQHLVINALWIARESIQSDLDSEKRYRHVSPR